jgi:translation initiation factor IF-2
MDKEKKEKAKTEKVKAEKETAKKAVKKEGKTEKPKVLAKLPAAKAKVKAAGKPTAKTGKKEALPAVAAVHKTIHKPRAAQPEEAAGQSIQLPAAHPQKEPHSKVEVKKEGIKPEVKHPEVKHPEVKHPEIKHPEIKHPEAKHPEIKHPEIKQPEPKHPEIKHPEVKHPEVKHPEAKRPETKHPEVKHPAAAVAAAPSAPVAVPVPTAPAAPAKVLKDLVLDFPISVKDLSIKLQEKSSSLIKLLMGMGVMSGINQFLTEDTVSKVCEKYGYKPTAAPNQEETALAIHNKLDSPGSLMPRWPIVTIMGHVDHGKTSLLDAIRKTNVAESEFGGITQHIGAYTVKVPKGQITFLDTPGHEAFTAMRSRGAKATDIVVLVVAADDGIMPQTQESIDHARAAGVAIIVAINKIDKPQADLDRVKKQLSSAGLMAEDWGGKTITVPVSAKNGQGIDTLLDMIILESEMLELKANPNRLGKGVVLEGKMIKNKGPVSTLLVQTGSLHLNSSIVVGNLYGKIRAMFNDRHQPVTSAGPSEPVEVLGISGVPEAGEQFFVIEDEKTAKELVLKRQEKDKLRQMQPIKRMGLEDLYSQIKEGKIKELKIVLKADAQGSVEAIKGELGKIESKEVQLQILHEGIGNINYSDVILALASDALILGFNVVVDEQAKALVNKEGQDVRVYNIIYELVNEIRAALEGMLAPKLKRVFMGRADIRKIFKLSSGLFAGCQVTKGKIARSASVCLIRNGVEVYEGTLSSLKRFKDDVREVEEGFECGMALKGHNDIMEGDVIEAFSIQKIARTLD